MRTFPFVTYVSQATDPMDESASPIFAKDLARSFVVWGKHPYWQKEDYAIAGRLHAKVLSDYRRQRHVPPISPRQLVRYHVLGACIAEDHRDWATAYECYAAALAHIPATDLMEQVVVLSYYADVCGNVQDFLQAARCWERLAHLLEAILADASLAPFHPFLSAAWCEALTNQAYNALAIGDYAAVSPALDAALQVLFTRIAQTDDALIIRPAALAPAFSSWDVLGADHNIAMSLGAFLRRLPEDETATLWRTLALKTPWTWALALFYQQRLGKVDYAGIYQHCFAVVNQLADVYLTHKVAFPVLGFSLLIDIPFAALQEECKSSRRWLWQELLEVGNRKAQQCWQAAPDCSAMSAMRYLQEGSDLVVRYGQVRLAGRSSVAFRANLRRYHDAILRENAMPAWVDHLVGKTEMLRGIIELDAGSHQAARVAFTAALDAFTEDGRRKGFMPRQHEIQRLLSSIDDG